MAFTFRGTYTQNRGDAPAAGTVTIFSRAGAELDDATLDDGGSYELVIDAQEGEVKVVEAMTGVPVRSFEVGVSRGSVTDTSRDIGYIGPSDGGGAATEEVVAQLAASGKGFVSHGATAGTARPAGYASVEWYGTVEPDNAIDGDSWVDTTP